LTINDRLTRGFVAGAGAEIIRLLIGLAIINLGLRIQLKYLDFASVMIFGHKPQGVGEAIFGEVAVIGWTGILGIAFAYLIPHISSLNYRFKGALYGAAIWFAVYAVTILYKVSELSNIDITTALFNEVLGMVWGILLVEALKWLDGKVETD
jgi:hypothetical protein